MKKITYGALALRMFEGIIILLLVLKLEILQSPLPPYVFLRMVAAALLLGLIAGLGLLSLLIWDASRGD